MKGKLKKLSFNVMTIDTSTKPTEFNYCHWAKDLKMIIEKDGTAITLDSEEIQKLVKTLPRTVGGQY